MNYVVSMMLVAGLFMAALAPDTGLRDGGGAPGSGETLAAHVGPLSTTPEVLSPSAPDDVVQESFVQAISKLVLGIYWRRTTEDQLAGFLELYKTVVSHG